VSTPLSSLACEPSWSTSSGKVKCVRSWPTSAP
jgi:hypothetical protein